MRVSAHLSVLLGFLLSMSLKRAFTLCVNIGNPLLLTLYWSPLLVQSFTRPVTHFLQQ